MSSLSALAQWTVVLCFLGCSLDHPSVAPLTIEAGFDVTDAMDVLIDRPDAVMDRTDVSTCGLLGRSCCALDSASLCSSGLMCMAGSCVMAVACPRPSEVDCGGVCVNTMTDAMHCGRCANACRAGANSVASCAMGGCRVACIDGFGDCNGEASDGCETNLGSDTANCGVCNNPCSVANGRAACTIGRCAVASCDANFADCDTNYGNGCETDTRSNLLHCSGCGMACPMGANSTATCVTATCGLTCTAGFGNCDGMATNGCETATSTNISHCGRCANACPTGVGGAPTCAAGSCGFACASGRGDCNGTVADGCETNTNVSTANCGRCANQCTFSNASVTCVVGVCALGTCSAGFANCDNMTANGCEANINTSTATCGACGTRCAAVTNGTSVCTSGICGEMCNAGFAPVGLNCVAVSAPRPISPVSTSTVTSRRPTFRWVLGTEMDGAQVEVCRDRACSVRVTSVATPGSSTTLSMDLAAGTYFWRLFGQLGATTSTTASPVWQFTVGARSAGVSNAYGVVPDVNGDGLADLVVGAPQANRAFVYFGSRTAIAGTASQTLDGSSGGFGRSVAAAGDVNGDGFGDLIVGAGTGAFAFVYLGGPTGLSLGAPTRLTNTAGRSLFGFSSGGIGDFNGDGYGDVAVGDPGTDTVFVYFGSSSGVPVSASLTIPSPSGISSAGFGASVGWAGDVNADGFGDLVVGGTHTRSAWVFHGGAMPSRLPMSMLGPGADYFGVSVASAGDVNGDGYCDVLTGSYLERIIILFRGGASGLVFPGQTITGVAYGFGRVVSSSGDVNGDGMSDVSVGSYADRAFVFLSTSGVLPALPSATLDGVSASGFGESTAWAGDTNGDNFSDLIVGAYHSSTAFLYRGSSTGIATTASSTLTGPPGSFFGLDVASRTLGRGVLLALR